MRQGQFVVDPINYLMLKSRGLTDHEIANQLSVHHATVRNRLTKLYADLGAHNGYHAVALGISDGLIPKVTYRVIEDGSGNTWERCGPTCKLEIVRPGKVQCECDAA